MFLLTGTVAVAAPRKPPAVVDVAILAINDLHGNLVPPWGGISVPDPAGGDKKVTIVAGGVEYMATLVHQLRRTHRNSIFVAAGDLVGASPLLSGLFHDEPTVESMSQMGLDLSSVGNHEFDDGRAELLRLQNGGCHPTEGCTGPHHFDGARFHYLAANVVDTKTGKTLFPSYYVRWFDGLPVAFIGLTLHGTGSIISPAASAGLEFRDEADTVNALIPKLQKQGVQAFVVLLHEGGTTTGAPNECKDLTGPITQIVPKLDKAVDVVVSGHTHQAYNCVIDGRLVTSAHRYGTVVTEIDLKLDRRTHDVVSARANNVIVRDDTYAKDPAQTRLIAAYNALVAPVASRVVGKITAPITRAENDAGESALGEVIADAQLAAGRVTGAQIAFMNSGGIRADLKLGQDGAVSYADLFEVQPFGNTLVTLTLSGAQIKSLLELQWVESISAHVLQVSRGFTYTWDKARPVGDRVVPGSLLLNGKPLDPAADYRVVVSNFLADGGDGLSLLREGRDRVTGIGAVDAMEAYLRANSPLAPPSPDRIKRLN
ncbi:MAG: bifunctional metallophosphatase/5'-nucleotidase [Alphaproteobacteria bacterium]|nr:bifunctional metallophosphatase/5'-nucleotidase [Alphaproteobacteria bacterium]